MLNIKKLFTKTLDYMVRYGTKQQPIVSGEDLNDYKGWEMSGFYEIRSGVSNSPAPWSWLIVIGGAGTLQLVFIQNRMYARCYTGTPLAWTAWKSVALS